MTTKTLLMCGVMLLGLPADSEAHAVSTSQNTAVFASAKAAVTGHLKDPDSARFGGLIRQTRPNVRGEPTDVVCGNVNARNSFGGYTGMSGFVYFVEDRSVYLAEESGPGDVGAIIYYRFCGPTDRPNSAAQSQ